MGRRKDSHGGTDSQIFRHEWRKALSSFPLSVCPRLSVSACVTVALTDGSSSNLLFEAYENLSNPKFG